MALDYMLLSTIITKELKSKTGLILHALLCGSKKCVDSNCFKLTEVLWSLLRYVCI